MTLICSVAVKVTLSEAAMVFTVAPKGCAQTHAVTWPDIVTTAFVPAGAIEALSMLLTTGLTPSRSQFPHGTGMTRAISSAFSSTSFKLACPNLQRKRIANRVGIKRDRYRNADLHTQNRQGKHLRFQVDGRRRQRSGKHGGCG